jgi:chemotaxis signal transduction protein
LSSRIILVQYARQGKDLLLGLAAEAVNDLKQLDAADLASPGIINADAPYLGKVAVSTSELVQCVEVEHLLSDQVQALLFDTDGADQ